MRLHVYLAVFRSLDTVQIRRLDMARMKRKVRILIGVDSICAGRVLPAGDWCERRVLLDRLKIYENFDALDKARAEHNVTLGLIKPARITALRIQKSASQAWTSEEIDKLQSTSG